MLHFKYKVLSLHKILKMETIDRTKILDDLAYRNSRENTNGIMVDTFQEFIQHHSEESVELLVKVAMSEYLRINLTVLENF